MMLYINVCCCCVVRFVVWWVFVDGGGLSLSDVSSISLVLVLLCVVSSFCSFLLFCFMLFAFPLFSFLLFSFIFFTCLVLACCCYSRFVCCRLVAFLCDVILWLYVCLMCLFRLFVFFLCVFSLSSLMAFVDCGPFFLSLFLCFCFYLSHVFFFLLVLLLLRFDGVVCFCH